MKKSGFWCAKVALKILTLLFMNWDKYPLPSHEKFWLETRMQLSSRR
ncbi:unnamed protein product [Brassica rapa subsp. narinosa]